MGRSICRGGFSSLIVNWSFRSQLESGRCMLGFLSPDAGRAPRPERSTLGTYGTCAKAVPNTGGDPRPDTVVLTSVEITVISERFTSPLVGHRPPNMIILVQGPCLYCEKVVYIHVKYYLEKSVVSPYKIPFDFHYMGKNSHNIELFACQTKKIF